jgi:hypothetical protein
MKQMMNRINFRQPSYTVKNMKNKLPTSFTSLDDSYRPGLQSYRTSGTEVHASTEGYIYTGLEAL